MPTKITLEEMGARVGAAREALGMTDTDDDAMRNKGHARTESKKALLRAIAERARAAGVEPPIAYIDGKRV